DSRNGVLVNGRQITGESPLAPGDVLIIGACEIDFTHHPPRGVQVAVAQTSGTEDDVYDIVERASGTRFDKPLPVVEDARTSRTRSKPGLQELYQLARAMAEARDTISLAQETLDGLFAGT